MIFSFLFNCCLVYPDKHSCFRKSPQGQPIYSQMQKNNWRKFVGELLLAKFCRQNLRRFFLSEIYSMSLRRSLRRRIGEILVACIFLFQKTHRYSTTNFTMHHGPKPKRSTRRRKFLHQIYPLESSWRNLDCQFVLGPQSEDIFTSGT